MAAAPHLPPVWARVLGANVVFLFMLVVLCAGAAMVKVATSMKPALGDPHVRQCGGQAACVRRFARQRDILSSDCQELMLGHDHYEQDCERWLAASAAEWAEETARQLQSHGAHAHSDGGEAWRLPWGWWSLALALAEINAPFVFHVAMERSRRGGADKASGGM